MIAWSLGAILAGVREAPRRPLGSMTRPYARGVMLRGGNALPDPPAHGVVLVCRGETSVEGNLFAFSLEDLLSLCILRFKHHVVDPKPVSLQAARDCLLLQRNGVAYEYFDISEARAGGVVVHFLPHRLFRGYRPVPLFPGIREKDEDEEADDPPAGETADAKAHKNRIMQVALSPPPKSRGAPPGPYVPVPEPADPAFDVVAAMRRRVASMRASQDDGGTDADGDDDDRFSIVSVDGTAKQAMEEAKTMEYDWRSCGPRLPGGPQSRVWHLLNNPASSWLATLIWLTITTAILLSTVSFITETSLLYYKPTSDTTTPFFAIESACIAIFVIEIALRFWSCPSVAYYFQDFMNYIDLAAVVPYFVDLAVTKRVIGLQMVRVLRLTRAMRLLKLSQKHLQVTLRSVTVSLPVLDLLFLILLMAIVFFGSLVWFGEHGNMSGLLYEWLLKTDYTCDVNVYQSQQTDWSTFPVYSALVHGCTFATDLGYVPNQGYGATFTCPNYYDALPGCARNTEVTPLQSIPHSAWLSIVTMTTTGFGDINPVTAPGRIFGGFQCIAGMMVIALPATVLQANFYEIYRRVTSRQHQALTAHLTGLARKGVQKILKATNSKLLKVASSASMRTKAMRALQSAGSGVEGGEGVGDGGVG